jgi:hypothetical protein
MSAATVSPQRKEKILEIERGNIRSHSVETLRRRLRTCRKTDYGRTQ